TVIGWRPHDLDRAYLPFSYGVGVQVGLSDPVFMGRLGKQPITESNVKFPHDTEKLDKAFEEGDGAVREMVHLGIEWMKEANSGIYRTWEDLAFLRENWEGPIVLKGIQSVDVRDDRNVRASKLTATVVGRGEGAELWRRWDPRLESW